MGNYARELILEAIEEPQRLLHRKKFWKLPVFQKFLEEITTRLYTDGRAAYELAKLGPRYAELVAAHQPQVDLNILLIRAYGHLGNAYRVLNQYVEADATYDRALALPAPPTEHADINRRRSYLRVYQGRPEEGHDCADSAVETYKRVGDLFNRHHLGTALIARGYTHYQNGRRGASAVDLTAAIGVIDYRRKPRSYYNALHNLSTIMVETIDPDLLDQCLRNLKASYKRLIGHSQRHMAKNKIRWLQALAQKRFGATRQAENYFRKAFNGFVDMKATSEVAMVSLDIAMLYVEEWRFSEAQELARNVSKIVNVLGMPSGALAAMALWEKANQGELTQGFLKNIRQTVVTHAQPYGT